MATSTLRNVGGSVMMTIPKAVVDELGLTANTKVEVLAEDGRVVAVPHKRPKYTLDELLAQCDLDAPFTEEDRQWLDDAPSGREVI
ncbi:MULTISPECIES: AbrB/MazE/SpoVT family DNA-binding domain-containing protein [unclassified Rhizobium]|uniref:AbrB/MazE/SpoVT family DNA-binding domain-containing protein n=1 Tax=unclassified Rhizobium TaxID=2613769 RepID=UPI001AD98E63|nr:MULTISPECIES: AbrB/MazE/SpoVT family DNA-binding domain-containing protein [unclassified Rhizobium]MBO9097221.1 AbrB/MazE/SpoVT family DNA-binding domain-containing protein [Rhizobium sp. L58/93]MBO9133928.1 AbrB/MazE/SpoVT family DNA-binding domain-containing protein [Rhizobium sp. B209b/85]MBO9167459.1 AbrB/MazE/SpoVT family DNA-binding domain-containing protein [Rhizobium sp. L245/93]MBO9183418.1 AbrB/MazE/SpoVT family DNA-binding domain-containing protein [Rhizobium sp. E27B/91]QXZ83753